MILGKPNNDNYIGFNSDRANTLQELGFIPFYRDGNNIYFLISESLKEEVLLRWNLQIK